jgi:hypothetical protein
MIITSSQQIQERINPSEQLDLQEFELLTLVFASYLCIIKNKKLNYLNFLKLLVEDKKTQDLYCKVIGDTCFQNVVRMYLNCTPNACKKIFRSKGFLKKGTLTKIKK